MYNSIKRGLIELPACFVYKQFATPFHLGDRFESIQNATVRCRYCKSRKNGKKSKVCDLQNT